MNIIVSINYAIMLDGTAPFLSILIQNSDPNCQMRILIGTTININTSFKQRMKQKKRRKSSFRKRQKISFKCICCNGLEYSPPHVCMVRPHMNCFVTQRIACTTPKYALFCILKCTHSPPTNQH